MSAQACRWCICKKCVQLRPFIFQCPLCKATFDVRDDGEKGGNPERRAMDKEEYQIRQRQRRFAR